MSQKSPLHSLPLMCQQEDVWNTVHTHSLRRFYSNLKYWQNWRDECWTCQVPVSSLSHFLSLSLCDAAVSVLYSSPYKYSSWLMDPAAAVCCPIEHGHTMYTQIQIQMCRNTYVVFVVVKEFHGLLLVGGKPTLVQHQHHFFLSSVFLQNSCITICSPSKVLLVLSLATFH